jgi:hypothetical protein
MIICRFCYAVAMKKAKKGVTRDYAMTARSQKFQNAEFERVW